MGSDTLKNWAAQWASEKLDSDKCATMADASYDTLLAMLPLIEACMLRVDHASEEAYERDRAIDKALRDLGVPDA